MTKVCKGPLFKWYNGKEEVIGRFVFACRNHNGAKHRLDDSYNWIMEVVDEYMYVSVDPKSVEEILPYTVTMSFPHYGGHDATLKEVQVPEDCGLKENDVILYRNRMGAVVKINSKSKSAEKLDATITVLAVSSIIKKEYEG